MPCTRLGGAWSDHAPDNSAWESPAVTDLILGKDRAADTAPPIAIPLDWGRTVLSRIRALRDSLRGSWTGLAPPDTGHLTDWLLACLVARENALLLGPPGGAKSEIATRVFTLLGLSKPEADEELIKESLAQADSPIAWWRKREERERKTHKYFHYLLSRFTQPEELFGPIEIELLRRGFLVRVNFGQLTGPGVRAAFLDEVFKAGSSILNTLLTLTQERHYPNWGGQKPSDLVMFIGASNEMPGGFSGGVTGAGGEDFLSLYAFLDRFPLRLLVPIVSGTNEPVEEKSHLGQAFGAALGREGNRFATGELFPAGRTNMPSINDVLLLGRLCYQHLAPGAMPTPYDATPLDRFRRAFLRIARDLQGEPTNLADRRVTWTVSPRKLRALYKIALARAVIGSDADGPTAMGRQDLRVFDFIWDSQLERDNLTQRVAGRVRAFWGD